jgi:hypothetical protein
MHVAVLGGGLQGCCIALALAERRISVTLFDRNELLLSRAAVANEGKVHLGYMYAADPTLSTARMMMRGALGFAPFFARHLGQAIDGFTTSEPAVYLVHRDSQRSPEQISSYLKAVNELIGEAAEGCPRAYFGKELNARPRRWSASEREVEFDPANVLAAFATPEVAIDPVDLARKLRDCIAATNRIGVRLEQTVLSVHENGERPWVVSDGQAGTSRDRFDHVVNALWDGRLAIDETLGLRPDRPWLHRLKYGVSFRRADTKSLRSVTIVTGPFGEVVSYGNGLTYLTWYPACLRGISREVSPPDWVTYPEDPVRSRVLNGTLKGLSDLVFAVRQLDPNGLSDVCVKGGNIFAWGKTDIDDPSSELHRRFEIGVTSMRRFHSVDPGKLTMAPYFAELCAERVASAA